MPNFRKIAGFLKEGLLLLFFLGLGLFLRCSNHAFVFIGNQVFFLDPDCYSRMTRVKMILAHPFQPIHHHNFENFPQGIVSHATAPFDYLIALLAVFIKPFTANYLDVAGAFVSPLLAAAMIVFLWDWSRRVALPYRGVLLLLFAVSPILVLGTILGRPDHQSLEMLCIVVALGAEWSFLQKPSRGWGIVSGVAWGLGLWVSFYEPLILLVLTLCLYLAFDRSKLSAPERRAGYAAFGVMMILMLLIDGLPFSPPDKTLLVYFPRWEKTVGELTSVGILNPLLYRWAGLWLIAAPVLFLLRSREDKRAVPLLALLLVVWGLSLWQVRWGYFFVIVYAMTLPFQFKVFRKNWIVWCLFIPGLWPVFRDWTDQASEKQRGLMVEKAREGIFLREIADMMKSDEQLPFLAPWWLSPALVYWSGQPAVAGSSHESMAGIVDSSEFYLTDNYEQARRIVRYRNVKRVVAYDASRTLMTASALLDKPGTETSLGVILGTRPHSVPPFLKLDFGNFNSPLKVYDVVEVDARQ